MKIIERISGIEINPFAEIVCDKNKTKEQIEKDYKNAVLKLFYNPYYSQYLAFSPLMIALVEKYKDVPLTKYEPTDYEKKLIEENPAYAENIPEYYVPGFDRIVGGATMDGKLKNEFYDGWMNQKDFVFRFVNSCNRNYHIVK